MFVCPVRSLTPGQFNWEGLPETDPASESQGAASTHLDGLETNDSTGSSPASQGKEPGPDGLVATFRHSGWAKDRAKVRAALVAAGVAGSRISAFSSCGSGLWVQRSIDSPEIFRVVPDLCHDRFCVPCSRQRQLVIRRNLESHLDDSPHRLLTLTVRSETESLEVLVDRLYRAFRRLRTLRFWKNRVTGGAAFLEVTFNPERGSWHPHLHCIIAGKYLDLQDLSSHWLSCTGDSKAVDIRLIRGRSAVLGYVTKYATKAFAPCVLARPEQLKELVGTLAGRRAVISFGKWQKWGLLADPGEAGWALFEHLNAVRFRATQGDELCENIMAMLATADRRTGEFIVLVDLEDP